MSQIFTILIVISVGFFIYFKIKQWRASSTLESKWQQTRGNIALGVFLISFSLNSLYFPRSKVEIIVGIVFGLLGIANVYFGYQAYKHYLPQLVDEIEKSKLD